MNLQIDSMTIAWTFMVLAGAIALFIIWFRVRLSKISKDEAFILKNNLIHARNKYQEVNVFKWSNTFLKMGMITSLAFIILAFNWTTFEVSSHEGVSIEIEDVIENDMPRTIDPPKPPPPPPPPPVIEEVEAEEDIEDDIEFIDNELDEETIIEAPPPAPKVEEAPKPILALPPDPNEGNTVVIIAEQMPRFPGCEDMSGDKKEKDQCAQKKLLQFLSKNIKYPNLAKENGIDGTAVVRFVVEKNGSLSNISVLKDPGGGLGKEAIRVVKKMNTLSKKWTPGKQNARPVRVQFNLPIRFRLE